MFLYLFKIFLRCFWWLWLGRITQIGQSLYIRLGGIIFIKKGVFSCALSDRKSLSRRKTRANHLHMSRNWGRSGQEIAGKRIGRPFFKEFEANKDGNVHWMRYLEGNFFTFKNTVLLNEKYSRGLTPYLEVRKVNELWGIKMVVIQDIHLRIWRGWKIKNRIEFK